MNIQWTTIKDFKDIKYESGLNDAEGINKITINRNKFFKKPTESTFIPKGAIHRIENKFNIPVKIVEVQMGNILKETDIVRYKDVYGRVN